MSGGSAGRLIGRLVRFVAERIDRAPRPVLVAQVTHVAGDAGVAAALAHTLFFDVPIGEARLRVGLYLALAFAPYAVVAPLVNRVIANRFSYRSAIGLSDTARAALAVVLAFVLDSPLLYVAGFAVLVMSRVHSIARNALLPDLVTDDDELLAANAGVSIASGIAGAVGGAIAFGGGALLGPVAALAVALAFFVAGGVYAFRRTPDATVDAGGDDDVPIARNPRCRAAIAGLVGAQAAFAFTTFLYAFVFHGRMAVLPVIFAIVGLAGFVATVAAPPVARRLSETAVVWGALVLIAAAALLVPELASLAGAFALVAAVGFSARLARLGFDSIVQAGVARSNRLGRYARYEVMSQLAWVGGAAAASFLGLAPSASRYVLTGVAGAALLGSLVLAAATAGHSPSQLRNSSFERETA